MRFTNRPQLIAVAGAMALLICRQAVAVDFRETIEAARAADTEQRPMVVCFGAAWCGWCRKMEVNTFQSPEVDELADKFLWVKLDVDEYQELAARYRVHGLPRTIVLDAKGRTIGSVDGYLPPERFVRFLTQTLANPQPDVSMVDDLLEKLHEAQTDAEVRDAVTELIVLVAKPVRQGREEVLAAFKDRKLAVQSVLLDLMSDERLAIRAAAGQSLKHCLGAGFVFDPFADKATRAVQLADCRKLAVEAAPTKAERE
jgi:thioredoxin-related protein